jgi:hypothetical protein
MPGHARLATQADQKELEKLAELFGDDLDDYDFIDWREPMSFAEFEARQMQSAYVAWKRERGRTVTRPMLDAMTAAHRLDDEEEERIEDADR